MDEYSENQPAQLRRWRAAVAAGMDHSASELIGQGPLWKMVRAALTDPDGELWRYSIAVGGGLIAGAQIRSLRDIVAQRWGGLSAE